MHIFGAPDAICGTQLSHYDGHLIDLRTSVATWPCRGIDRSYSWGNLKVLRASYHPVAFSDHMAYTVSFSLPTRTSRIFSPRTRPLFKIRPEVILDQVFQERLKDSMADWTEVKELGLDVLQWWEILVKPGIKNLTRRKEEN